ncbi:acyltransferase family protein [Dokdonella sp.]|uniref:acyltransferase family protein n=1 Tax=Dokdonella sp. TaxID=2291710 RepID=UPI003C410D05
MTMIAVRDALLARPPVLDDRLGHGPDNSLLLRHLAALLVIYGHAYALVNPANFARGDLFARLIPQFYSGSIGVCVFFALSGCLITRSWLRNPRIFRFIRARILRIYPAYLVCLLLTVGLIGPLFNELAPINYFEHAQTGKYFARNVDLVGLTYMLPGLFASNPFPYVANGSLWSLALEVRMYLAIAILGVLRVLTWPRVFVVIVLFFTIYSLSGWIETAPQHQDKAALAMLFMMASLAALFASRIPLSTRFLLVLVLLAVASGESFLFVPMTMLALGYFSLWFSWRLPAWKLPWRGDYSYGLFLYGFPVQQMIVATFPSISPLALFAHAVPSSLILAIASWHWVEQPSLRLKQLRSLDPARTPGS